MKRLARRPAIALGLLLAGCVQPANIDNQPPEPLQSLMVSESGLINLTAHDPEEVGDIAHRAGRLDQTELRSRRSATLAAPEALPFLSRTGPGRQFLALGLPRALARGEPAALCPATGFSGPDATSRPAAVTAALGSCFAELEALGAPAECGCTILALDRIVAAPQAELAYSTGTAARIRSAALGIDSLLVAEDVGPRETMLRDLRGPVGLLRHLDSGRVELELHSDPELRFTGSARFVGFRRGRIAERIYLEDAEGRRISLLIGFSPDELAESAGAWLSYPVISPRIAG